MGTFRFSNALPLRVCLAAALVAIMFFAISAQEAPAGREPAWSEVEPETVEHYSALLRLDTSNPPGNETRAAQYLKEILDREGIDSELLARDPERANLVARIKGNGSRRPILLMGHTDTVGVERRDWSVDPFGAVRKDGFIYGRGAQDDKDHVTAGLMVMLLLKRLHIPLDRDVIFLAEAGEEGSMADGIDFLVREHWGAIDAEYALAEGGAGVEQNGRVQYIAITTAEKVPRGIRLVAHGTAGHGSRPIPDNAVARIASAVAKVAAWQTPIRLNETTRAYFERLAAISPPEQAERYKHIADPRRQPAIDRYFFQHEPGNYSVLRTSVAPTMISGGFRINVIPSQAEAYLDIRALPDEDLERFRAQLRQVIGDPAVEVEPPRAATRPVGPPSRLDTGMFRALERAQRRVYPGAVTIPAMLTGATDMAQVRAKGVQAYGFGPVTADGDGGGAAHGDDERLSEEALHRMVRFAWYAVLDVAATK